MSAQVVVDSDGRVVSWDAEAERLMGYAADEVVGRLLGETIVPAQHHDQYNSGLAEFRATGTIRSLGTSLKVDVLRKDGTEIPATLRITQLSAKPPALLVLIDPRTPADTSDPYTGTEHRDYAADTEAARSGRAKALAGGVTEVAAEVEADRIRRAKGLAAQSEHDVAAAAADVEAERLRIASTLATQSALGAASAASILEEERIRRAVELAIKSMREANETAAELEADRVRRATTLANQSARGVSSAAADVEADRITRATKLGVEAEMAKRRAEGLASEVTALTVEVGHLRKSSERMEGDLAKVLTALAVTAEAMRAYGADQLSTRERARFPGVLMWFGTMLEIVASSGKTGLVLLDELVEQRASRMHMTKTGLVVVVMLTPVLVAILSWILARNFGK